MNECGQKGQILILKKDATYSRDQGFKTVKWPLKLKC